MLTLKQLHYALAVEKTLHFKKAAEACNVSQSALSTGINELEKQLGIYIFERNNKQVLVTDHGQLILNKAKDVMIELNNLLHISMANQDLFVNQMSIGVIPTIGPYLLPKILPAVRKKYPNFKLKILEYPSNVLVDMVRKGEIDAAILALPFNIDGLINMDFWQEDFYWVSHKEDALPNKQKISIDELELGQLMLLKDGHCLREHALAACKLQIPNRILNSEYDSISLNALIQMVAGKMGTTLVPEMTLEQLIYNEPAITAIHFNEPGPHRTISLVVRPSYSRIDELKALRDIFVRQLKECVVTD